MTKLERAVLESVAYSDVFDFPVTLAEIRRGLSVEASMIDVERALRPDGPLGGKVVPALPHYTLAGREALVPLRERRREASLRLTLRAQFYGRWIARLPFVRMVGITGSLAVDNADTGDDVDYLIVTAPGRVWLARTLTMVIVRLARLRGLTLCPNFVLSEAALALTQRDAYAARELMQMRPVVGGDVYARLLAENAWARDLLPNWQPDLLVAERRRPWLLTQIDEMLLGGRLGDMLERWFLRHKGARLRSEAGDNPDAVYDETMCKGHVDGHRGRLQEALAERLQGLGAAR